MRPFSREPVPCAQLLLLGPIGVGQVAVVPLVGEAVRQVRLDSERFPAER